jgi:hypothetical protein
VSLMHISPEKSRIGCRLFGGVGLQFSKALAETPNHLIDKILGSDCGRPPLALKDC